MRFLLLLACLRHGAEEEEENQALNRPVRSQTSIGGAGKPACSAPAWRTARAGAAAPAA